MSFTIINYHHTCQIAMMISDIDHDVQIQCLTIKLIAKVFLDNGCIFTEKKKIRSAVTKTKLFLIKSSIVMILKWQQNLLVSNLIENLWVIVIKYQFRYFSFIKLHCLHSAVYAIFPVWRHEKKITKIVKI